MDNEIKKLEKGLRRLRKIDLGFSKAKEEIKNNLLKEMARKPKPKKRKGY